jgi:hypothetical protein
MPQVPIQGVLAPRRSSGRHDSECWQPEYDTITAQQWILMVALLLPDPAASCDIVMPYSKLLTTGSATADGSIKNSHAAVSSLQSSVSAHFHVMHRTCTAGVGAADPAACPSSRCAFTPLMPKELVPAAVTSPAACEPGRGRQQRAVMSLVRSQQVQTDQDHRIACSDAAVVRSPCALHSAAASLGVKRCSRCRAPERHLDSHATVNAHQGSSHGRRLPRERGGAAAAAPPVSRRRLHVRVHGPQVGDARRRAPRQGARGHQGPRDAGCALRVAEAGLQSQSVRWVSEFVQDGEHCRRSHRWMLCTALTYSARITMPGQPANTSERTSVG